MTNREEDVVLDWTSRKSWGSVGLTHDATHTDRLGRVWKLTVDQPSKRYWAVRGWVDGDLSIYREVTSMREGKRVARDALVFKLGKVGK